MTFNSVDTIEACLRSLLASSCVVDVAVVDNGSSDETLEVTTRLATEHQQIRVLTRPDNPGYATAVNHGWQDAQSDYLLVLNPDTVVPDHAVDILVSLTEPGARRILAPVTRDERGSKRGVRRLPTLSDLVLRGSGKIVALELETGLEPVGQPDGAALLVPRAVMDELGGFDEGFPLYFEDVDFAARASALGISRLVAHQVEIDHLGGDSFRRSSEVAYTRSRIGRVRYARLHLGRWALIAVWLGVVAEGFVRWSLLKVGQRRAGTPNASLGFFLKVARVSARQMVQPVASSAG